jgi:hypothetical protein
MLRTWTSGDGQYTVEAQFIKKMDGKVRLRKKDGAEIDVPVEKLSQKDREFIGDK